MGHGAESNGLHTNRDKHVCFAASVGIRLASSLFPRFAAPPSSLWGRRDSNPQHADFKSAATANCTTTPER